MEVTAEGHDLRVVINGRPAATWRGDRQLTGHIGLQNHDDRSLVRYRDVVVEVLG
jgi:hypothetical protein